MSNEDEKTRSTDMLAKEAIEHIRNTAIEDLEGFVPDDEDRVTVLRAWESKLDSIVEESEEKKQEFHDFYHKLRNKVNKNIEDWKKKSRGTPYEKMVGYLLFLPDLFYLMLKMLFDKDVPTENKGALVAGLVYVMSPIDLIPDYIPIAGWIDDLVVSILALNKYMDIEDPVTRRKIEEYWLNDEDFFKTFKHLLDMADEAIEFLPKKFLKLFKGMLERARKTNVEPEHLEEKKKPTDGEEKEEN